MELSGASAPTMTRKNRTKKTQEQIDQSAKTYDFKRTNRFNKDLIGVFENVYNSYSRLLSNMLVMRLGTNMKLRLEQISQTAYLNYVASLTTETVSAVFTLSPMRGPLFFTFDSGFLLSAIDSILGGDFKRPKTIREFTEVEKEVIRVITGYFIDPQRTSWNEYLKVDPNFRTLEFNPVLMSLAPDLESLLILDFVIEVANLEFPLKLAIPHASVENVTQTLIGVKRHNDEPLPATDVTKALIRSNLNETPVELRVVLGRTQIQLSHLRNLQVGDVFQLSRQLDDLLPLYVEQDAMYLVQAGISKNKMSVQIVDKIEKPDIFG